MVELIWGSDMQTMEVSVLECKRDSENYSALVFAIPCVIRCFDATLPK